MHQEASMDKQFQLMFISALIQLQLYVTGFKIRYHKNNNIFIQLKDNSMFHQFMIQTSN